MTTRIIKTKVKIPEIPGTKPSIKNAHLLVSTGIPSLDYVIGGGLPIGSLFVIEEDTYGTYAKYAVKYMMAESIVSKHSLLIASQDMKPSQLLEEIPAPVPDSESQCTKKDENKHMKIAWRYHNLNVIDPFSMPGENFGHHYDLTKAMDNSAIKSVNITQWHETSKEWTTQTFENTAFIDILKTIQETLKKGEYFISNSPEKRNILRIVIHSLGSRLWLCGNEGSTRNDILKFLYCFRALLRNSYAVGAITVPADNFHNTDSILKHIEHLSDVSVKLESFADSPKATNPLFKDYHGILHIRKSLSLNTLQPHHSESKDLAFVLRRRKFLIGVLHLPPELDSTTQREQDELLPSGQCGDNKDDRLCF